MSKKREKEGYNIKRVVESDHDCVKAMNVCHAMKREHLKTFISDNRIQKMTWDRVFDKIEEPKTGEFIWVKGKNYDAFIEKHNIQGCEFRGKGSSNQDGSKHHDLGIANHYCFNMTREEQQSCRTEAQQRYEFEEYANLLTRSDDDSERDKGLQMLQDLKENNISVCDLAYTSRDGVEVGFEITTENYTAEMVQAKESYCDFAGLQFVAHQV